tara:strand:+ start:27268 stop:27579 length:312 start_codon:yes stop_codon:yes gene_type:complete
MEIDQQQCQQCGSLDMRNILVRSSDGPMTVYVRCLGCESLVARYRLTDYYHRGKGMESFLRSLGPRAGESGRDYLAEVQRVQKEAERGYTEVISTLTQDDEDI